MLKENVLPAKLAATYVCQMAEAIHYAHQHGTLHRDLKPSNILIDEHDQIGRASCRERVLQVV